MSNSIDPGSPYAAHNAALTRYAAALVELGDAAAALRAAAVAAEMHPEALVHLARRAGCEAMFAREMLPARGDVPAFGPMLRNLDARRREEPPIPERDAEQAAILAVATDALAAFDAAQGGG